MDSATKDSQRSGLRVADSDRDRAIAELSEHYQAGRITTEEFEERTGRALQARTAGDLAELFTDLPRKPSAGPTPRPAAGSGLALSPTSTSPARIGGFPVIPLVIAVAIVVGGFVSGHSILAGLAPLLITFVVVRRIIEGPRRDQGDYHHGDRRDRHRRDRDRDY